MDEEFDRMINAYISDEKYEFQINSLLKKVETAEREYDLKKDRNLESFQNSSCEISATDIEYNPNVDFNNVEMLFVNNSPNR